MRNYKIHIMRFIFFNYLLVSFLTLYNYKKKEYSVKIYEKPEIIKEATFNVFSPEESMKTIYHEVSYMLLNKSSIVNNPIYIKFVFT